MSDCCSVGLSQCPLLATAAVFFVRLIVCRVRVASSCSVDDDVVLSTVKRFFCLFPQLVGNVRARAK